MRQSSGVVMSWLAPVDDGTGGAVSGYNIWRWHNDVWTPIEADTGSTALTYTDTDALVEGDWYGYVVRAINAAGAGEWSETTSALINPSLPSAPRRFVADAQSSGVVMSWLAPVDDGTGGAVQRLQHLALAQRNLDRDCRRHRHDRAGLHRHRRAGRRRPLLVRCARGQCVRRGRMVGRGRCSDQPGAAFRAAGGWSLPRRPPASCSTGWLRRTDGLGGAVSGLQHLALARGCRLAGDCRGHRHDRADLY